MDQKTKKVYFIEILENFGVGMNEVLVVQEVDTVLKRILNNIEDKRIDKVLAKHLIYMYYVVGSIKNFLFELM